MLLVELGIVNEKPQQEDDELALGEPVYSKKCDDTLRKYVLTKKCRWKFIDDYFENPAHGRKYLYGNSLFTLCSFFIHLFGIAPLEDGCCDNCIDRRSRMARRRLLAGSDDDDEEDADADADDFSSPPLPSPPPPSDSDLPPKPTSRSGDHYKNVVALLTAWRRRTWELPEWRDLYPQTIMTDRTLEAIARSKTVTSVEDFASLSPPWSHALLYGDVVMRMVWDADRQHEEAKEAKKAAEKAA